MEPTREQLSELTESLSLIPKELSDVKEKLTSVIRMMFNPEENWVKLLIVGAAVLRIGIQMVVDAELRRGATEDESYETVLTFMNKWREQEKEASNV